MASFEKLKDIFGGTKMITLSENCSAPHPDSMAVEGAGWSYFMPWYGDYTMDGWAHDNTAAAVELFTLSGTRVAALNAHGPLAPGSYRFPLGGIGKGAYLVRVKTAAGITFRSVLFTGK